MKGMDSWNINLFKMFPPFGFFDQVFKERESDDDELHYAINMQRLIYLTNTWGTADQ